MSSTLAGRYPKRFAVVAALLALAAAPGCGTRKWAPVSGRITINGQPMEGIFVYFSPAASSDPMNAGLPSRGRTGADGRYSLLSMDAKKDRSGALVGAHTVTLDDERTFEKMNVKSRVPAGWQSTFEVTPQGTDKADFDLNKR